MRPHLVFALALLPADLAVQAQAQSRYGPESPIPPVTPLNPFASAMSWPGKPVQTPESSVRPEPLSSWAKREAEKSAASQVAVARLPPAPSIVRTTPPPAAPSIPAIPAGEPSTAAPGPVRAKAPTAETPLLASPSPEPPRQTAVIAPLPVQSATPGAPAAPAPIPAAGRTAPPPRKPAEAPPAQTIAVIAQTPAPAASKEIGTVVNKPMTAEPITPTDRSAAPQLRGGPAPAIKQAAVSPPPVQTAAPAAKTVQPTVQTAPPADKTARPPIAEASPPALKQTAAPPPSVEAFAPVPQTAPARASSAPVQQVAAAARAYPGYGVPQIPVYPGYATSAEPAQTVAAVTPPAARQSGARIYSVGREFGQQPDPIPPPTQAAAGDVPMTLDEVPDTNSPSRQDESDRSTRREGADHTSSPQP
jgi:hypothetical protein